MSLKAGTRLGPYEILSLLGAGGMGEVYKAHDTRLDRIVALKTLRAHLAEQPELKERFEREARTVASLQHEHICVLHDIRKDRPTLGEPSSGRQAVPAPGGAEAIDYLVLEYLEGETLATRLLKGPLPLAQVLQYSIEISDALDKAHRKEITHRDIKPGNIMLVKSGSGYSTKLLDFGLAKLKQVAPKEIPLGPDDPTPPIGSPPGSPTIAGTILGTFQYMAPEQAEGKNNEIDARTDIFSFGAVIYEMVTGKKAFEGKTQVSLVSAILKDEPPAMSSLVPVTPPALDRVVKQCLAKEPDERWQTASDLCRELQWIKDGGGQATPVSPRSKIKERVAWTVAAVCFLAAVAALFLTSRQLKTDARPVRFSIPAPEKAVFSWYSSLEISPDGNQIAFVALLEGKPQLWIRPLDSLQARALPGTEGAISPFWSPDSQFLGFFSGGKLNKIAVSGGVPQALCDGPTGYASGTWSKDGVIVFRQNTPGPLYRVSATGGAPVQVTELDQAKQETTHTRSHFLPDGKHFLYRARSTVPDNNAVYVASLDSKEKKLLFTTDSEARYAAPGYLLFGKRGVLLAQRFDPDRLELSGEPFQIVEAVHYDPEPSTLDISASDTGVLAYRGGKHGVRIVWVDRSGKEVGGIQTPGEYRNLVLSPDEKRVIFDRYEPQVSGRDLWLYDFERGTTSRFTFDPADDDDAVWSPDGQRIVFSSNRNGTRGLFQKPASGVGQEEVLIKTDLRQLYPRDWSADGRYILYVGMGNSPKQDLWVLPLFGDRKPYRFLQSEFRNSPGGISPDGRWIAYVSFESGKPEVYAQTFPNPGGKWQISTGGGGSPTWRHDGKELFYVAEDGEMMAVPVTAGSTFQAGLPKPLFRTNLPGWNGGGWERYAVSADGQRFLIDVPSQDYFSPMTVVQNWAAGLKK